MNTPLFETKQVLSFTFVGFDGILLMSRFCRIWNEISLCYLVLLFKQQFSLFKYHNTYFYNTFSPTHISKTFKQRY